MTLKLDKRHSNGMTLLASYVLSKQFSDAENAAIAGGALDHFNKSLDKALPGNDQTHMLRFAYTYDLPFGRGKHFNLGPVANFGKVTSQGNTPRKMQLAFRLVF